MNRDQIAQAAGLIQRARKAIVLTGAGASTESGIPDFRGRDGLWSRYDPMEYGTIGAFRQNPRKIWAMLAELCALTGALPNAGHLALAKMEQAGYLHGIITQNIDGLHQRAGSRTVIEFHGSMATFSCLACGSRKTLATVKKMPLPPGCHDCGSIMKPDIIFFDEQIPAEVLARTDLLLTGADLLLVAGTSCQVMPAARIPAEIARQGGAIIEINRDPALGKRAHRVLAGSFAEIMTALAEALGCAAVVHPPDRGRPA